MRAPTYTALIRWRGPDPSLEIETSHAGFASPEEAALYANGISPASPQGLHLSSDGSATLHLGDHQEIPCRRDQMTIWAIAPEALAASDIVVAGDGDFVPVAISEIPLRSGAHGDYLQAQYGVLDQDDKPVDVQVTWDEAERLRVTVADASVATERERRPTLALGVLPEA